MTTQATPPANSSDNNNTNSESTPVLKGINLSQDQINEWGNGVILEEPKVKAEDGTVLDRSQRLPTNADLEKEKQNDEQSTKTTEENQTELPEAAPLTSVVTAEDPGDYQPQDYSFEVTIYTGEEGKEKPKTVKIKTVEDAETLLEQDPNFGSAKNLLDFNRKVTRMETNSERDQQEWQKQKDLYDKQVGTDEQRQQNITNIANEINYLVAKGKLPKAEDKYLNADWSDPEVAKQPGVKEALALLSYMSKENGIRTKANLAPLTSALDAYNAWIVDETEQKNVKDKKTAGEQRKEMSAKVSGGSPAPVSNAPKGISVGHGGSLRDMQAGWTF